MVVKEFQQFNFGGNIIYQGRIFQNVLYWRLTFTARKCKIKFYTSLKLNFLECRIFKFIWKKIKRYPFCYGADYVYNEIPPILVSGEWTIIIIVWTSQVPKYQNRQLRIIIQSMTLTSPSNVQNTTCNLELFGKKNLFLD